jgi:hypothetical protein
MTQYTHDTTAEVTRNVEAETAAAARWYSDFICIWRLCGSTACLRARSCRGDGVSCFNRCLQLVPPQVRNFLAEASKAQQAGLTWDEVIDRSPEGWRAVRDWSHAVAKSMPGE